MREREEVRRTRGELELYASFASHDLQEPLRKIITFSEMVQKQCAWALPVEGRAYLQRIEKLAQWMRILIQDLVIYTNLAKERSPIKSISLKTIVNEALVRHKSNIAIVKPRIVIGPLPRVRANPDQLQLLFANLLDNAFNFREYNRRLNIWIQAQDAPTFVRITVADNGRGFDNRYAERIFRPFERLHAGDVLGGSGMGLAICQRIARRHGGSIVAHGRPGEGAAFTITLPKRRHAHASKPRRGHARRRGGRRRGFSPHRASAAQSEVPAPDGTSRRRAGAVGTARRPQGGGLAGDPARLEHASHGRTGGHSRDQE